MDKEFHDDEAERQDMLKTLFELVKDEKYVEILHEYFVKERSLRDIAKDSGVSRQTVNNRLKKLIDRLNFRLREENA
jgi:RNA polymerase sigma factor (sigma-70 family)